MAEAEAKLGGSLRMHMHHGPDRIRDPKQWVALYGRWWWRGCSSDGAGKRYSWGMAAPKQD